MKPLILFFLTPLLSISALAQNIAIGHGTTILTAVTLDSVVMAGDTRETIVFPDNSKKYDTVQKVFKYKDVLFGIAGTSNLYTITPWEKFFEASLLMEKAIKKANAFEEIPFLFFGEVKQTLNYYIDRKFLSAAQLATPDKRLMEFDIATNKNGLIKNYHGTIIFDSGFGNELFYQLLDRTIIIPNIYKSGFTDHIEAFLQLHGDYLEKPFQLLQIKLLDLIKLEAENHKYDVSCPINLITIKKQETKVLVKKIVCD